MKAALTEYLITTGRLRRERLDSIPPGEWLYHEPIGRLAIMHGLLSGTDVEEILRQTNTDERQFGETAVRLGMISREQLDVLRRGQSIRACLELIEDLALAGIIDFTAGLEAIKAFTASGDFAPMLDRACVKTH
jgi:hypothetical protein